MAPSHRWVGFPGLLIGVTAVCVAWYVTSVGLSTIVSDVVMLDAIVPERPTAVRNEHLAEFRQALGLMTATDVSPVVRALHPPRAGTGAFLAAVLDNLDPTGPASVEPVNIGPLGDQRVAKLWTGRRLWRAGHKSDAVASWRAALPSTFDARTRLAEALYISGEFDLAFEELAQTFYLSNASSTQRRRATTLLRHWALWSGGRQGQASDAFLRPTVEGRQSHTAASEAGDVWALRALATATSGDVATAAAVLAQLPGSSRSPFVLAVAAQVALMEQRPVDALDFARAAVLTHDQDGHALLIAASVLRTLRRFTESEAALTVVIEQVPELASEATAQLAALRTVVRDLPPQTAR